MRLFRPDLLELKLGEARIEAVGMLGKEGVPRRPVADLERELVVAADVGLRVRRGRSRSRHLDRHQRHVVAAERSIHERLLLVGRRLEHVVAHEAEGAADIEARRRQMLRQRDGEGAVGAVAVLRREAGLGRIGDKRVGAGWLDLGQAAADGARSDRALHGLAERIVAAGVEDHQAKLLWGLDCNQDAVEESASS
ncbi:hypothetical protein ACVWXO_009638 [Bradyrhizobium sp. LM2.7]